MIKVADFGLTEDMYCTNYFSEPGNEEKVPIRWMAPESISAELYSEKTDVVRFLHNTISFVSVCPEYEINIQ